MIRRYCVGGHQAYMMIDDNDDDTEILTHQADTLQRPIRR